MTKSITKTLLHLLKDFKSTEYVTEIDFIQKCLNDNRFSSEDIIIDYFLKLTQCEEFLNKIAKDFIKIHKLIRVNEEYIKILIFFFIFVLDSKNAKEILEDPVFYTIPLLNFLCMEEKYPIIAKWATQYFDNDFVVHNVLEPLLGRVGAFKAIIRYIEQEEEKKMPKTQLTIPKPFKLSGSGVPPPPPANTPDIKKSEVEICEKTHRTVTFAVIQHKLEKEHKKHGTQALALLKKIKVLKVPTNKTAKMSAEITDETQVHTKWFTPTKLPPKKEVEIKKNIATTLRDASRLLKEQEEEVNRIQNILKGGCCSQQIEVALVEDRKNNEKAAWQYIQRRHLEGLITFEEAILAKKKLLEDNKAKFLEVQAEKMYLNQILDEFKEREQKRVKAKVEQTHKEKEEAKKAEKEFVEKKLEEARMREYELKEMLKQRELENAVELANKMELIQEIKNIHEINMKMNEARREFDPTETSNLGLLCEMSIAELRERLAVEKMKMCQELETKHDKVQTQRRQQQVMIERYKEFIDSTRKAPKMLIEPVYRPPVLEENSELQALRKQLEEKRSLRISM